MTSVIIASVIMASVTIMESVIYGKCYLWQMYYGKCNYGKRIYGKSIMANKTEPVQYSIPNVQTMDDTPKNQAFNEYCTDLHYSFNRSKYYHLLIAPIEGLITLIE